jgi:hypothetical protein
MQIRNAYSFIKRASELFANYYSFICSIHLVPCRVEPIVFDHSGVLENWLFGRGSEESEGHVGVDDLSLACTPRLRQLLRADEVHLELDRPRGRGSSSEHVFRLQDVAALAVLAELGVVEVHLHTRRLVVERHELGAGRPSRTRVQVARVHASAFRVDAAVLCDV